MFGLCWLLATSSLLLDRSLSYARRAVGVEEVVPKIWSVTSYLNMVTRPNNAK